MCDKAVDNYPHAFKFVPDCYMTQKSVIKLSILIILQYNFFLIAIRIKKCVIKILINVFLHLLIFLIDIKLKKCVTELFLKTLLCLYIALINIKLKKMCNEAVDNCLAALKFILDWFVTSKMLEKLDNASDANRNTLFYNEDFDKVTFIACEKHILAADLDKINLDNDNNFDEDDPDTIIHVRLLDWRSKFKKHKTLKKW